MTIQVDLSELKTFADWCRVKDCLPAEAKCTVEALLFQLEGYIWAKFADEILGQEWDEWRSKRRLERRADECNCDLADRILSTCHFLETQDWSLYSFQLTDLRPLKVLTHLIQLDLNGKIDGRDYQNGKLCDLTPLTALTNLLELNLHGNSIADLSPLAELTNLIELDLSSNQITDITPLAALTELTNLDLSENLISDLAPLAALKDLNSLNLSNNHLTDAIDISPLLALTKLTDLNISGNAIVALPPEIGQLKNLQYLDLSGNQLTSLPPEIGLLENLQGLGLSGNQLTSLPLEIGLLENLQGLGLSGNQLTSLPPEIGLLENLQGLDLSRNQLIALPPEIGKLKCLIKLNLERNRLTALPPEIAQVGEIYLTNNPIEDLSALANHPYRKLKVFAFGVQLPRQYWTHLSQWKAEWLLTENNAEIRRVLIQQIGYDRICEELKTVKLDNWREYTLLKIEANVDDEPIHLLKMTCPSTNHIHVLRVPPIFTSARAAIRWANWDIDPKNFAVET